MVSTEERDLQPEFLRSTVSSSWWHALIKGLKDRGNGILAQKVQVLKKGVGGKKSDRLPFCPLVFFDEGPVCNHPHNAGSSSRTQAARLALARHLRTTVYLLSRIYTMREYEKTMMYELNGSEKKCYVSKRANLGWCLQQLSLICCAVIRLVLVIHTYLEKSR